MEPVRQALELLRGITSQQAVFEPAKAQRRFRICMTDITHVVLRLIDCFDGMVVSWSLGTRPDAELVNTMLDAAIETVVDSEDRPVAHSDRVAHHRWPSWLAHR